MHRNICISSYIFSLLFLQSSHINYRFWYESIPIHLSNNWSVFKGLKKCSQHQNIFKFLKQHWTYKCIQILQKHHKHMHFWYQIKHMEVAVVMYLNNPLTVIDMICQEFFWCMCNRSAKQNYFVESIIELLEVHFCVAHTFLFLN